MASLLKQFIQFLIMVVIIFGHNSFGLDTDIINSSLVLRDSETIHSSDKVFVLGFFSPNGTTSRYVGIWYYVSPETVAWVANRDRPLNDSSGTVSISSDGNIVVMNGQQEIVWSSNLTSSRSNTTARLLDSGNLVLQDGLSGSKVWESFVHPTDTFLPAMRPSYNPRTGARVLFNSWRTIQDPGHGDFTLGLDTVGVAQSYIWERNGTLTRWRSGPWNGQVFIGITRRSSVYYDSYTIATEQDGTAYIMWNSGYSGLIKNSLNATGFQSIEAWNNQTEEWDVAWTAPANDCDLYNHCGPFAFCSVENSSPICRCLRGYEPRNRGEWSRGIRTGGCLKRTAFHCERNGTNKGREDGFWEVRHVKVPDFEQQKMGLETETNCRTMCLRNCSCLAYAYDLRIGCMLWSETLLDIQKFADDANAGTSLYVRLSYSELVSDKKNHSIVIILSGISSSIAAFVCFMVGWWICKRKGQKALSGSSASPIPLESDKISIEELPLFSFEMLATATNNFDMANKLGKGGFGPVFKGKLTDNIEIAVKRLSTISGQGLDEFMNEVILISKLQHRNLVSLLGCCVDNEEKMLVYEYVKNRSLDAFLFDQMQNVLDWKKRFHIIEGIARGLLYLHRDSRLRIIHRDLKPSNVLLDEEWNPKISDFGMARIFGGTQDQAETGKVVGTYGYMAPEYVIGGRFSEKSDVYSFGVIMLEIISGRKNTSFYNDELSLSLLGHAWKLWNEDKSGDLVDTRIGDPRLMGEFMRCTHIALLCVQEFHGNRPTISTVVSMLSSEIVDLPTPGRPGFTEAWHVGSSTQYLHSANEITVTIMLEGR